MLFFISLLMCCVGHLGSLIGIKKEGDVFVATKIGDLYIPTMSKTSRISKRLSSYFTHGRYICDETVFECCIYLRNRKT